MRTPPSPAPTHCFRGHTWLARANPSGKCRDADRSMPKERRCPLSRISRSSLRYRSTARNSDRPLDVLIGNTCCLFSLLVRSSYSLQRLRLPSLSVEQISKRLLVSLQTAVNFHRRTCYLFLYLLFSLDVMNVRVQLRERLKVENLRTPVSKRLY